MLIRLRGSGPLHERLYRELREGVLQGRFAPGDRLPSTRALAEELDVSRTVVLQAYERLRAEGYLEARVGAGTFVTDELLLPDRGSARGPARSPGRVDDVAAREEPIRLSAWGTRARAARRDVLGPDGSAARYDFLYGRPVTETFPFDAWRRIVNRLARRPPTDYGDPRGSLELRRVLAGTLGRNRAVRADPDQIVVVTGSQQGLDLAARVLLDEGDGVVVEDPAYRGARQAFRAAGARLHPVATDGDGLVTDRLPRGAARDGGQEGASVRMAYVTPSHQFPSGGVLPLARRLELLAWAREEDAVVLEDDYDGEFRHDGPPVEACQALDDDGRVVYLGTLSKVLYPALRLGYLVLPPALVEPFVAAKWVTDRHSPLLEQEALARFIREGHFRRHLRRTGRLLEDRRDALLSAVREAFGGAARVEGAASGMHVVLWLPGLKAARVSAVVEAARERDVGVYPVAPYYAEPPDEAGLLLGWASLTADDVREGVRRLERAVASCG